MLTYLLVLLLCSVPETTGKGAEDSLYHVDFQQLLQSGRLDLQSEDTIDTGKFSPWSYEPVCSQKIGAINDPLCVYTNKEFSGGRGISIFTTPRLAEEVAALLAFRDPTILADHGVNRFQGNWYTQEVPGKGIGMLAKSNLKRGDTITAYTPVLLAFTENILPAQDREKFLQIAVNQLPVPTREAYLRLASLKEKSQNLAQDIASANSFEVQIGGQKHLGVFPETSRVNHACAPNAQFHINSSLLTHWVRAARPISTDEEITIAYYSPLEPFAKRQRYLRDSFHFTCNCSRCLRGAAADEVLAEISALQTSLGNWAPGSGASVKQAERLIQIYQEEGLEGYLDPAYCHAALTYNAVGSVRGAKKYLELAIQAIELRLGPAAPDLATWRDILDDPTAHWSWRRRKRT